ncbi:MAG: ATP-binding cassette domain-containing protein [Brumimicrobium sp.]|nr:ATP-binding cassette domain-containing protein [Brumimicrobium sp.]
MFAVHNISFEFPDGRSIFRKLNFTIQEGEIICVVGHSGAGKSTLLNAISSKVQLTEGEMFLDEDRIFGPEEKINPEHKEIAMVDQSFRQDIYFTVSQNIQNQLLHFDPKERISFTSELLEVFDLTGLAERKSYMLSGGEKQRLSMACALAKEPRLLLLDEPFVHLDVHLQSRIGSYIRRLAELRNMSVIFVTHRGEEALGWADRIFFLSNGQIKTEYTPEKAYFKPRSLAEGRFFGELNSVYSDGKQILFRPNEYSLFPEAGKNIMLEVMPVRNEFRGAYYANYFKLNNNREIVVYNTDPLMSQNKIYVAKN